MAFERLPALGERKGSERHRAWMSLLFPLPQRPRNCCRLGGSGVLRSLAANGARSRRERSCGQATFVSVTTAERCAWATGPSTSIPIRSGRTCQCERAIASGAGRRLPPGRSQALDHSQPHAALRTAKCSPSWKRSDKRSEQNGRGRAETCC